MCWEAPVGPEGRSCYGNRCPLSKRTLSCVGDRAFLGGQAAGGVGRSWEADRLKAEGQRGCG